MGADICQYFIVPEIKSLCLESTAPVKCAVSRSLLSISKIIEPQFFSQQIYPLYTQLSSDKDDTVRKVCADQIGSIAEVTPDLHKKQEMRDLYYAFIKDKTSKLVRGTAF